MAAVRHVSAYLEGGHSLEQAEDAVQEAAGGQDQLHGLQAHGVALGRQMHGRGAEAHGDAVALLQLQRAVQQRGQLRQAIAAGTAWLSHWCVSEEFKSASL